MFVIGRKIARITEGSYWIKGHMASSIIECLLGISHVDPIKNTLFTNLLFCMDINSVSMHQPQNEYIINNKKYFAIIS